MNPAISRTTDGRAAVLHLMSTLVAGPRGAAFILAQFRANSARAEFEAFTWRGMFK